MNAKILLRVLIASEVTCNVAAMLVHFATLESLPTHLKQYYSEQVEHNWTAIDWIGFFANAALGFAFLISWIGLWQLWRPARMIYLVATVGTLIMLPTQGPTVCSAPVNTLLVADALSKGLILGVIYFSDVRANFDRSTKPLPPGSGASPEKRP